MSRAVRFVESAAERLVLCKAWWRANRDRAPGLFDAEFESAIQFLTEYPEALAPFRRVQGRIIRQYLMARTRTHLRYYVTDSEVVVVAVRGAVEEPR